MQNDLYSFDGLIKVTLKDGSSHNAVWILGIPELGKSGDNSFEGLPDNHQLFYEFDTQWYAVWTVEEIDELTCIQQRYLK